MSTPTLTEHARERCAEMGISTKVAKRIVQAPDLTRPGSPGTGCLVSTSDAYSDYIVVHCPDGNGGQVIVTVAFRLHGPDRPAYVRNGTTYTLVEEIS